MKLFPSFSLAAAVLAMLAACASPKPRTQVEPPPSQPSGDAGQAGSGAADAGEAAAQGEQAESATGGAAEDEGIILKGPEGTTWVRPGATSAAYRADIEACFRFAQAQVAHDARIESDAGAAFQRSEDSGLGLRDLQSRMSAFERDQRRSSLFTKCMEAKGYARR